MSPHHSAELADQAQEGNTHSSEDVCLDSTITGRAGRQPASCAA